jgi:hypothetical protein
MKRGKLKQNQPISSILSARDYISPKNLTAKAHKAHKDKETKRSGVFLDLIRPNQT